MAQTIKLKRSATQGAAPTTSNLALGEVAINTYDGKMYIKKDVGGTESIVEVGSGANTVSYLEAGMIEYEYTATSNQTTFSGSDSNSATLSYTANSIMVFLNGVLQDDGVDYTATNGTSVVFGTGLVANDEVRIVAFTNVTTNRSLQDPTKLDAITTVNAQAAYSLTLNSSAYTPSSQNALIVSLNGITQEPGDSFTISGSTITFSPALVTGDVVDYIVDMGRAVTIGEYSGDLAVGGELEVTGDIIGDLRGAILFKAQAGEALSKGDVVYISGISGNTTVVSKADADDSAKMPAFGVVSATASSGTPVDIYTFGTLSGLDTSSFSEGDELFVSTTAGTLTNSAPTGESAQIQKIAKVTRSDNSAGSIKIMGAGRSNATPNLDDGDIFIGNASNQAVTASLNTKIEDYLDAGTSTPSFSTINSGNITTTGYIAGPSTFTIDPAAVGDNTGTLVVAGNLQVDGTTTTINSTTMTVDDLNITLASGAANAAAANGAGITVDGASATLTYNSTPDAWSFNKNLGIGETDPDTSLHITSTSADQLTLQADSTTIGPNIVFANNDGNLARIASAETNTLRFEVGPSNTEAMRINSDGLVGIGIDPVHELDILANGGATLRVANETDSTAKLILRNVGSSDGSIYQAAGNMSFAIGASEIVVLESGGDVGIGVSNPTQRLDVREEKTGGGLLIQVYNTDNSDTTTQTAGLALGPDSRGATARITAVKENASFATNAGRDVALTFSSVLNNSPTERMRIKSDGNVGIGTDDPDQLLDVGDHTATGNRSIRISQRTATNQTTYGGIEFFYDNSAGTTGVNAAIKYAAGPLRNDGELTFHTGATGSISERLRIDHNGNVGVGTASPNEKLNVSGNIRVTSGFVSFSGSISTPAEAAALYRPADNTIAMSTANVERMRIINNGRVGIGTTDPARILHVEQNGLADLLLRDTSSYSIGTGPAVIFQGNDSGGTITQFGAIYGVSNGSNSGELTFETRNSGSSAERMRLDSSGNLLFNTTNTLTSAQLTAGETGIVLREGNLLILSREDGAAILVNRKTSNGDIQEFRKDGSNIGSIGSEGGDSLYIQGGTTAGSGLLCHGGAAKILPVRNGASIDATIDLGQDTRRFKDLYLSGGAYLGGTGAANKLDDYEEGTWTPNITNHGGSTTGQTVAGVYTKIGNICHFQGVLTQGSGTTTGFVSLGGFPFNADGTYGHISINTSSSSMIQMSSARVISGYNAFVIKDYDGDGVPSGVSGPVNICFQGSFQVA